MQIKMEENVTKKWAVIEKSYADPTTLETKSLKKEIEKLKEEGYFIINRFYNY